MLFFIFLSQISQLTFSSLQTGSQFCDCALLLLNQVVGLQEQNLRLRVLLVLSLGHFALLLEQFLAGEQLLVEAFVLGLLLLHLRKQLIVLGKHAIVVGGLLLESALHLLHAHVQVGYVALVGLVLLLQVDVLLLEVHDTLGGALALLCEGSLVGLEGGYRLTLGQDLRLLGRKFSFQLLHHSLILLNLTL